jgi:hypothetical protein
MVPKTAAQDQQRQRNRRAPEMSHDSRSNRFGRCGDDFARPNEVPAHDDVGGNPMKRSDHRNGEAPTKHVRSERTIRVNDEWFITTREGIDVGPYATRDDAESAAADLATMLEHITDPETTRQFVIREFMLTRWAQRRPRLVAK